ncbi:MAG: S9 family peptidase [Rikenellaceae bacterium]|nr:S9 family peptidase [Rikenellaceae bacterium]
MRKLFLFAVAVLCATVVAYGSTIKYEDIAKCRAANGAIYGVRSMADGEHFTIIKGKRVVRCSYADRADSLVVFEGDFRIGSYLFSADERQILLSDAQSVKPIYRRSFTADYYLADVGGKARRVLEQVRDVAFSPDNKSLVYSKENNLYLYDIATSTSKAITSDGEWNKVINGTSDWVYEEEYGFTKGYAVSADGAKIAYLRFDESAVPTFEMMRYDDKLYNKAFSFKYPKAGDKNSVVTLHLYDVATGKTEQIPTGDNPDQYIFNLAYTPNGEFLFYRVNRLQNHFEVLLREESGVVRPIYEEKSATYVERPSSATVQFVDGDRFIVSEETTAGYNHLYLHSIKKGRLNAITSGRWEVTQVVGVAKNRIYYLSTEQSPLQRNLYSVALNGKGKRCYTEGGFNSIAPSVGMRYYIRTYTDAATPNVVTVCEASGKVVDTLLDSRAKVAERGEWAKREYKQFVTERGDTLNYYIQLPFGFEKGKRYPVLLTQYSGPGSQSVRERWSLDWEDALSHDGYIVACCDGRGTGFRGEKFKKCTYADLGRKEVEDQISFARFLAKQDFVDAERIGIYGWSYGGFMALNCALHGEGLFRMAIAVAPVTSWRYYDTIYTEIYNGLPQDNPKGYDDNSPLSHAEKLAERTKLLIIHGTADDNVHFQNSMEMCRRLNEAGKQYDMMVYPDQNHSMRPSATTLVRQKMIDYTLDNL